MSCQQRGALWERLMRPFLLAALNTEPEESSAALAGAVLRETLAKGGRAYRPRIAHPTLAAAFVDPALAFLESKGATVRLGTRLRGLTLDGRRAMALDTGRGHRAGRRRRCGGAGGAALGGRRTWCPA